MDPAFRPRRPVTFDAAADRIPYVLIGWKPPHTVPDYWWRPCKFSSIISPLEPSTHAYRVAYLPLVSRQSRSTCVLMTNPFVAAEMIPGTKQVTVEVTLRSGLLSKRGKAFLRRRKHGLTLHGSGLQSSAPCLGQTPFLCSLLHFLRRRSWKGREEAAHGKINRHNLSSEAKRCCSKALVLSGHQICRVTCLQHNLASLQAPRYPPP